MEKMDDNTKNILYPKGSIFRILKDDIISAEFKIVKGAIAEAVSDIEVMINMLRFVTMGRRSS